MTAVYEPWRTQPRHATTYYDACGVRPNTPGGRPAATTTQSSRAAGPLDAPAYACAFDPALGRPTGGYDFELSGTTWCAATQRGIAAERSIALGRPPPPHTRPSPNAWESRTMAASSGNLGGSSAAVVDMHSRGTGVAPPSGTWRYVTRADAAHGTADLAATRAASGHGQAGRAHTIDCTGRAVMTPHDLARSQPWGAPALGHHSVPGSGTARLVGGEFRYVPPLGSKRDGHSTLTWEQAR